MNKETIKIIDKEKKQITLCATCEGHNKVFSKKWADQGYKLSHGMCKKCALEDDLKDIEFDISKETDSNKLMDLRRERTIILNQLKND